MLNIDFLEKGLELVSPTHFVYEVLRKMFLMLYSDVITDQISLLDCFYFLRYWTICIVYRLYCIIYVY